MIESIETESFGRPKDDLEEFVGVTANYRPPELWRQKVTMFTKCFAVDVWSFGCTMLELFRGKFLMKGKTLKDFEASVQKWVHSWHSASSHPAILAVPSQLRSVAWWCCAPDVWARPQMQCEVTTRSQQLPRIAIGRHGQRL